MKKRGVMELQFHWIFVLIAGAVIFIFFMNIVSKQREYSDVKASGTITTNLESILTGAQISTGTVNVVGIPKAEIGFECDRYFIGGISKQIKGNVIFAPGLLKGKELITWALDWGMPFRVTNFLYLTDPQVRYVIVYAGAEDLSNPNYAVAKEIYDKLPSENEIGKEMAEKDTVLTLPDKNNYKVRFIFVQTPEVFPNKLRGMPKEDLTAIKVIFTAGLNKVPSTGTINFFNNVGGSWNPEGTTFYLKKESLFGAIFAENIEMYNCVMRKAFKKLNLVTKVYWGRSSQLLTDVYYLGESCYDPHSKAVTILEDMKIASADRIDDFPDPNPVAGLGQMDEINGYSNDGVGDMDLEHQNQRAELFSCVLIY